MYAAITTPRIPAIRTSRTIQRNIATTTAVSSQVSAIRRNSGTDRSATREFSRRSSLPAVVRARLAGYFDGAHFSACSISPIRSSAFSMPMLRRRNPSGTPRAARSSLVR